MLDCRRVISWIHHDRSILRWVNRHQHLDIFQPVSNLILRGYQQLAQPRPAMIMCSDQQSTCQHSNHLHISRMFTGRKWRYCTVPYIYIYIYIYGHYKTILWGDLPWNLAIKNRPKAEMWHDSRRCGDLRFVDSRGIHLSGVTLSYSERRQLR